MKNTITVILLFVACTSTSFSQIEVAVKGGVNAANINYMSDDFHPAFKHIVRFSIGVSSSYYLNKHLSIQLEALYSEHGSRYNENFVFYSMYGHVKYTYVQAPLLLKYHFGPEALRFNVYAGPHYWQGVGNVETLHHFRSNTDVNKKSFEDANIYNFDFGITGGLGVSVPAFGGNIIGELRYQYGLTDFVKSDDTSSSNRNFQLLIGYAFLF